MNIEQFYSKFTFSYVMMILEHVNHHL